MELVNILAIVFTSCVCSLIAYYKYAHSYWVRREVPSMPASFPFGNFTKVFLRKISFTDQIGEIYEKTKEKSNYVGLYIFTRKILLVTHPELVKKILNSDFQYFHDRGIYYDEENEPLSAHLVSLSGEKWKNLRSKLTPTFTPAKLQVMVDLVWSCAEGMSKVIQGVPLVEIKDITARYTTDVVGSTAFGINCNSLQNPEAKFRQIGKLATTVKQTPASICKRMIVRNFPALGKKLKLKLIDPDVSSFFMKAVEDTVAYRNKYNIIRNDFLQLLMKLMNKENMKFEDGYGMTIEQVAAQCFVFFIAGVETSASTIAFALYELASNHKIQDRVRSEIVMILNKYDGKINYNALLEMNYMEKVVLETIRKYPAFTVLMRKCTTHYNLPETKLEKGTSIIIPVYAIHHDPIFYPNPEIFNPERFDEEQVKKRIDHTYIPFGSGPRICIGSRFAMIQVKVALAILIRDYQFNVNEKSQGDLVMDKNSFILSTKEGIWLDASPVLKEK